MCHQFKKRKSRCALRQIKRRQPAGIFTDVQSYFIGLIMLTLSTNDDMMSYIDA
jgi:hypothetical protein